MQSIHTKVKLHYKCNQKRYVAIGALSALAVMPELAHAITAPVAGDLAYDIYDVGVNKILKGPIGFVAGVATIGFGATQVMKAWPLALLSVLGGSAIIKADTIVASLGALI